MIENEKSSLKMHKLSPLSLQGFNLEKIIFYFVKISFEIEKVKAIRKSFLLCAAINCNSLFSDEAHDLSYHTIHFNDFLQQHLLHFDGEEHHLCKHCNGLCPISLRCRESNLNRFG